MNKRTGQKGRKEERKEIKRPKDPF